VSYGVLINPAKCVLSVSQLRFLGYHVNNQGVTPLLEQVQVIKDFSQPTSLRQLREFLGFVNFYHRFILQCTDILTPLNALLKTTPTNSRSLQWTDKATSAFEDIRML